MTTVFGGSDGIRTITFPSAVRAIRQGAFYKVESLRSVVLNEGLEALGTDECQSDGNRRPGVFQESGLERARLPSTLRAIEYTVFEGCASTKRIEFLEERKVLPSTLKEM